MIHVTRRKDSAPAILSSPAAQRAQRELAAYFRRRAQKRAQERPPFRGELYASPEVMEALHRLFHGKCAYCESRETLIEIDHFRPRIRALNSDGTVAPSHYWWLAYEWENLLPVCTECNRSKGMRFPVKRARAEEKATGPALKRERPLLLDPCVDRPEQHLVFTDEGLVVSDTERGRTTIEVLSLNREALAARRKEAASALRARFEAGATGPDDGAPSQEFTALRRQLLAAWGADAELPRVAKTAPVLSEQERQETTERFQEHMTKQQVYSVEAEGPEHSEAYYAGAKRIERIEITNFKAIHKLELTLPTPPSEREAWLMLLGENGTGKSSILQAVALALMGEEHAQELDLDASAFVRRGARVGRVSVKLTTVPEPVTVEFRRGSPSFKHLTPGPKALLQAYGATRLLRGGTLGATRSVQTRNLFDPTARLADVAGWLVGPDMTDARFDAVALALKDLLMLEDEDRFDRVDGRVEANVYGASVPLEQLSDGFQSVIALCGNIMMGLFERWTAVEDAEAIVLIDELEAHLHPTWKIEIVSRLRRTFPRVAFIASTHDPLALKGLEQGEIAVLRRDERRKIAIETDVPSVNDLRADQILTSFLFGLHSTRGDDATQSIGRYAELMSKRRRTPEEEQELAQLRGRLEETLTVQETPGQRAVEQALMQALDQTALTISPAKAAKAVPTAEELELRRQVAQLLSPSEPA
jgi:uncharacterized protein (TIGR02646 family)